ncbi:hypothetical protein AA0Y32_00635 [Georgenia phoenicis]|uniref:hypothetical protein n=1 Tax=unclassified Georgenia TaxID=2626815 RepID=UPI0039AEFCA6
MSDLQCPATVVVLGPDADGEVLRAARPAAVYTTPGARAAASRLAGSLDVTLHELDGELASRAALVGVLDDLSDEYRGECVAVVVTSLTDLLPPDEEAPAVVVEVDADGQRWSPLSGSTAR